MHRERDVSARRKAVYEELDALTEELVIRYSGPSQSDKDEDAGRPRSAKSSRSDCPTSGSSSARSAKSPACRCAAWPSSASLQPVPVADRAGAARPSAEILQQLARALRISVEALYVRAGLLGDLNEEMLPACARRSTAIPARSRAEATSACVYESFVSSGAGRLGLGMLTRSPGVSGCYVQRVALISLHTSPLVQPGAGDSGGMNVYVREVASAFAQAGVECSTTAIDARPPSRSQVEPGHRRPRPRRPFDVAQGSSSPTRSTCSPTACAHLAASGGADVIHGNYGSRRRRTSPQARFDVPLVSTFHTLARVKAEGGDLERVASGPRPR